MCVPSTTQQWNARTSSTRSVAVVGTNQINIKYLVAKGRNGPKAVRTTCAKKFVSEGILPRGDEGPKKGIYSFDSSRASTTKERGCRLWPWQTAS